MRTLLAFIKKEFIGHLRSGKLFILGGVFLLFGLMNPAVAKMTPWIMELFSETLAETGMNITIAEVSALDSWAQFYKNIPMALIVFAVLESNIFTKEYGSGTLVMSLTKGLERYKVVIAKSIVLVLTWTVGYWLCYAITYFGNLLFWDNSVAQSLAFSAVCCWLYGLMIVALTVLFSTLFHSMILVLLGTGGVTFGMSLISIIPKVDKVLPTMLMNGTSLVYGMTSAEDYVTAIVVTAVVTVACFVASVPLFNKKQL